MKKLIRYIFFVILPVLLLFLVSCSQLHREMKLATYSINHQNKKAYAVFHSNQIFKDKNEVGGFYKPDVRIKVSVSYTVNDKCEISIKGEPKFEIIHNNGSITYNVEEPSISLDAEWLTRLYTEAHEKDHEKRIEGAFPYIAFMNRYDNSERLCFELFEGAAVHASIWDGSVRKEMMNQLGSAAYTFHEIMNIGITTPSLEDFGHKLQGNAPLIEGENSGTTYWDAYNKYKSVGENGLKKEYYKVKTRVQNKMKNQLLNKVKSQLPCNRNEELEKIVQAGIQVGIMLFNSNRIEEKPSGNNYCWSCRVQDPGMSRCIQPSCPNYGNPPSMAR